MKYDVIGIGSPLIDITARIEDSIFEKIDAKKGGMFLFDDDNLEKSFDIVSEKIEKTMPGDSTANTIVGISGMGGHTAYIGKVGKDEHGNFFIKSMTENGVKSKIVDSDFLTGKVLVLVSPDSERTMVVGLGASKELCADDVNEEDIKNSKILHVTGYQIDTPKMREATFKAMDIAKENDVKISIDIADAHLIDRHREIINQVVDKYADIVFANETEAEALTGLEPEKALEALSKRCETAIVKIGADGSMIKNEGQVYNIPVYKVDAVDTTGAGDMYAAGVLYGMTNGLDFEKAGKLGALASSKVVAQIGARLTKEDFEQIMEKLDSL